MRPRLALASVLSLAFTTGVANHYAGGTIRTRCVGNNFHEITLELFRDCGGDPFSGQTLYFRNECGVEFTTAGMQPVSTVDASSICPSELPNTTCNGGGLLGYELNTYRTTVYLSPCTGWNISWYICCRNSSLNLTGGPGIYIETTLNNLGGECYAAPTFINDRIPTVCAGQPVSFDAGAFEPDGHQLSYELIPARFGSPTPLPVQYNTGYSGAEPYNGMTIDPETGLITFTPTASASFVVVVKVTEHDAQGAVIGSVMRDMVFNIVPCTNQPPAAESGVFSTSSGTANIEDDRSLSVCGEGPFCATLTVGDPDNDQELVLTSNIDSILPGAEYELTGLNPVNLELCSEGLAPGTYMFWLHARDNGCPVIATRVYHFVVEVTAAESAGEDGAISVCENGPAVDLFENLGGSPAMGGQWIDPQGDPTDGVFHPGISLTGIHTYTVGAPPCATSAVLSVVLTPATDPDCLTAGIASGGTMGLTYRQDVSDPHRIWLRSPAVQADLRVIGVDGRLVMKGTFRSGGSDAVAVDLPRNHHGIAIIELRGSKGAHDVIRVVVP
ncbi:MAG: hypothetical protein KDB95_03190 [Flavobacteriales bacterium]|nr:hypothetical protein [Flavobacteriales bacterium]